MTMKAFVIHETPKDDNSAAEHNPLDNGKLLTDVPIPTIPSPSYALIKVLR